MWGAFLSSCSVMHRVRMGGLVLLILGLLVACSAPPVRVVDLPDLLGVGGRQVVIPTYERAGGAVSWQRTFRAPIIALPLDRLRGLKMPVGTTPQWEVSLIESDHLAAAEALPEAIALTGASWTFLMWNDEADVVLRKQLPLDATLRRAECTAAACTYDLEGAANLFDLNFGAEDLPVIPARWPKPLASFRVAVYVDIWIEVEPGSISAWPPTSELQLRFGLVAGQATAMLSNSGIKNP